MNEENNIKNIKQLYYTGSIEDYSKACLKFCKDNDEINYDRVNRLLGELDKKQKTKLRENESVFKEYIPPTIPIPPTTMDVTYELPEWLRDDSNNEIIGPAWLMEFYNNENEKNNNIKVLNKNIGLLSDPSKRKNAKKYILSELEKDYAKAHYSEIFMGITQHTKLEDLDKYSTIAKFFINLIRLLMPDDTKRVVTLMHDKTADTELKVQLSEFLDKKYGETRRPGMRG